MMIRNRIYRWYDTVHEVEIKVDMMQVGDIDRELAKLEEIDDQLATELRVPVNFMPNVYDLRLHIAQVVGKLERRKVKLDPAAPVASSEDEDV